MQTITDQLHAVADKMQAALRRFLTPAALEPMDCDDLRTAYAEWISEQDALTAEYDRLNAQL